VNEQQAIEALQREAVRLGFSCCREEHWKSHREQLSYVTGERDALAKRCNTLTMQVDQCRLEADRWGRAFDMAVELRENIEQALVEKIDELSEANTDQRQLLDDAAKAEQEYESLIEKATRHVFRCLDHLGVKFDSSIALLTALEALKHRIMPDPQVPHLPSGELPFKADAGAALLAQAIARQGLGIMLDRGTLMAWWANIAMAGYDEHARKYSALLEAAIMPKQSGSSPRGAVYSLEEEGRISVEAEKHVDWSAPELQQKIIDGPDEVEL
jgi:hypothetical protein